MAFLRRSVMAPEDDDAGAEKADARGDLSGHPEQVDHDEAVLEHVGEPVLAHQQDEAAAVPVRSLSARRAVSMYET